MPATNVFQELTEIVDALHGLYRLTPVDITRRLRPIREAIIAQIDMEQERLLAEYFARHAPKPTDAPLKHQPVPEEDVNATASRAEWREWSQRYDARTRKVA